MHYLYHFSLALTHFCFGSVYSLFTPSLILSLFSLFLWGFYFKCFHSEMCSFWGLHKIDLSRICSLTAPGHRWETDLSKGEVQREDLRAIFLWSSLAQTGWLAFHSPPSSASETQWSSSPGPFFLPEEKFCALIFWDLELLVWEKNLPNIYFKLIFFFLLCLLSSSFFLPIFNF